jgi:ABC-type multidrug transport system fused ATPase/permease subunit
MSVDADLKRKIASNWSKYLKDSLSDMRNLFSWVWKDMMSQEGKRAGKQMFIVLIFSCVVSFFAPWTMRFVIDGLAEKDFIMTVWYGIIPFGIAEFINVKLIHFRRRIREDVLDYNYGYLVFKTTKLFFSKSLGTHIAHNRLLNEANIKKGFEKLVGLQQMLLFEGLEVLTNLVVVFIILWVFAIMAGVVLIGGIVTFMLLVYIIASLFLNQQVLKVCTPLDKKWRHFNRYRNERWENIERVKNAAKEEDELLKIKEMYQTIITPDKKFWLSFIDKISYRDMFIVLVVSSIIGYGVFQVWHDQLTLGLLVPLFFWSRSLAQNLWGIGEVEYQINYASPSIFSFKKALSLPTGLKTYKNPILLKPDFNCQIEFKNVGYTYPRKSNVKNGHATTINDISFVIEPGQKVGLVGRSGSGKTTIIKLILRHMDPKYGMISVDNVDLRKIDEQSWRRQIGCVQQKAQILDGTIKYNLLYELSAITNSFPEESEIWDLMQQLKIDFNDRLTDGLDTEVGRDGVELSGGQAQRLMIGAAVMKNQRFLLIDEATSSLDATTEKAVQAGLKKILPDDMSALIIAHRLSTLRICDKIIMLNNNKDGGYVEAEASTLKELAMISPDLKRMADDQELTL